MDSKRTTAQFSLRSLLLFVVVSAGVAWWRNDPDAIHSTMSLTSHERRWPEVVLGRQRFILGGRFEVVVEHGRASFVGAEDVGYIYAVLKRKAELEN